MERKNIVFEGTIRNDFSIKSCHLNSIEVPFYIGCTLRTVPTFVTAHTLCAFRDTRFSYVWVVPSHTGIFLRGFKLCRVSRT